MAVSHLFFEETLGQVQEVLARWGHGQQARHRQEQARRGLELHTTVESVVERVDPKLRVLGKYRKRLEGPVAYSLDYVDGLVNRIPPAVHVDRDHFIQDPLVNAFFVNPGEFQRIFSAAPVIPEFFERCGDPRLAECCALMCMHMRERKILGAQLHGGTVKREVAQVSVSFSDHQLLSPGISEREVRQGMKWCMFDGLVANAHEQVSMLHRGVEEVKDQERILAAKLRALEKRAKRLEPQSPSGLDIEREMQGISNRLDEVHQRRRQLGSSSSIVRGLDKLADILGHPEDYVSVEQVSMCLSKLGIKVQEGFERRGNQVRFAEVRMANVSPRVVALVYVSRAELMPARKVWERVGG